MHMSQSAPPSESYESFFAALFPDDIELDNIRPAEGVQDDGWNSDDEASNDEREIEGVVEGLREAEQETDYEDEDDSDTPDRAPSPLEPSQSRPTQRTRKGCQLVMDVLGYIKDVKHTTLAAFLKEFSWGDRDCKQNCDCHFRMTRYRTQFFKSKHFPTIIERWCKPPRSSASHRSRPRGGRHTIIPAAEALVRDELKRELKHVDHLFRSTDMKLTRQGLTSTSIPDLTSQIKTMAPKLWSLLSWLCGDDGAQRNTRDPSMVSHTISWTRSICLLTFV